MYVCMYVCVYMYMYIYIYIYIFSAAPEAEAGMLEKPRWLKRQTGNRKHKQHKRNAETAKR